MANFDLVACPASNFGISWIATDKGAGISIARTLSAKAKSLGAKSSVHAEPAANPAPALKIGLVDIFNVIISSVSVEIGGARTDPSDPEASEFFRSLEDCSLSLAHRHDVISVFVEPWNMDAEVGLFDACSAASSLFEAASIDASCPAPAALPTPTKAGAI